jgi:hypothetical protein
MRQRGKPRRRWEENIEKDPKGIGREDGDSVHLTENRKKL